MLHDLVNALKQSLHSKCFACNPVAVSKIDSKAPYVLKTEAQSICLLQSIYSDLNIISPSRGNDK